MLDAGEDGTRRRNPLSRVVSGLGWNTAGQAVTVLVNVGLTPFLLRRLGLDRYGLYALLASFIGLISNFDGGLGSSATRYFSVHAGTDDRKASSALLATVSALLIVVVGTIAAVVVVIAPHLTGYLHASVSLHQSATLLIRAFMPLLLVATLRGVVQSLITAHHRWSYLNAAATAGQLVYAGLAVLLVTEGHGLIGMLWASVGREVLVLVLSAWGARGLVRLRECRFMSRKDLREFIHYASRVQVSSLTSLVNLELDALIVSAILPIKFVSLYAIGANFASQVRGLPLNAISPMAVNLSQTFGRAGLRATIDEFTMLQRLWVRAIAAYALIGAVCAYFAIQRWLGTDKRLAGAVAAILLAGLGVNLLTGVMSSLTNAANKPGLESRYGVFGMVINIVFTIPLALAFGVLGVAAGTALGQIVGSLYFVRMVRRAIDPDIHNFLREVPWSGLLVSLGVTAVLEVAIFQVAPEGVLGLFVCAVPAAVGLAVYGLSTMGRREALTFLRTRMVRG